MHSFSEFKGNKMIELSEKAGSEWPFKFGQKKAKLIVANYDAIKSFADGVAPAEPGTEPGAKPETASDDVGF